ncbi:hypothetical protein MRB53_014568 [Persea americana]|uniref:Uncharacterized protein n=1 Tax=Persea americana TaxID=3435 RepID=A0ACC2KBK9_PERAE|nr:hypothetical protein MRB53_014568 [Persea americana]
MSEASKRQNSNSQLLQELEVLSQSLYQSHTTRCTASLALRRPPSPIPIDSSPSTQQYAPEKSEQRHRSRCMSLSP